MATDFDTIGSKEGDFYAEYWYKEELLLILISDAKGGVRDERRGLKFDGWLELKIHLSIHPFTIGQGPSLANFSHL